MHFSMPFLVRRKRELVGCFYCLSDVLLNVLWLFLKVPWIDLQCVIVVVPDRTYLLLKIKLRERNYSLYFVTSALILNLWYFLSYF